MAAPIRSFPPVTARSGPPLSLRTQPSLTGATSSLTPPSPTGRVDHKVHKMPDHVIAVLPSSELLIRILGNRPGSRIAVRGCDVGQTVKPREALGERHARNSTRGSHTRCVPHGSGRAGFGLDADASPDGKSPIVRDKMQSPDSARVLSGVNMPLLPAASRIVSTASMDWPDSCMSIKC